MIDITKASSFEHDPFPGRPKILFIGLPESSHTHAWINLLDDAKFNVRLFATPQSGLPPPDWHVRTYLSISSPPEGLDPDFRKCMFPTPEDRREQFKRERWNPLLKLHRFYYDGIHVIPKSTGTLRTILGGLILLLYPFWSITRCMSEYAKGIERKAESVEEWAAKVTREWQPDIIHTLGVFDHQGGKFYYNLRKKYALEKTGTWVAQLRGGSDLALRRHDPNVTSQIKNILTECDQILSDNLVNVDYAEQLGIPRSKFASIVPVPGTGGINVEEMAAICTTLPSKRRLILVPKAYESIWSKASSIFEGICLAWDAIQPCEVVFLSTNPESQAYYFALPPQIQKNSRIEARIPRSKLLNLMHNARVLLSPSLVDGVPNVLYEAMSCGVFPIVSPLDTITAVFNNEENVLFARNLYPEEIAAALVRAMQDDVLVDQVAENNLKKVRLLADRNIFRERIVAYYNELILANQSKLKS